MQGRTDGQGEYGTTADAKGELAQLEERAGLEATAGHAVDAPQGESEDDREGKQGIELQVRRQLPQRVRLNRGEPREEDQG